MRRGGSRVVRALIDRLERLGQAPSRQAPSRQAPASVPRPLRTPRAAREWDGSGDGTWRPGDSWHAQRKSEE
jgi:DNA-binding protein H-NS